ncbi:MAG: flagellar biosynthesis protein FlhF [Betaproteobacteria bacterium]|nr:flagellar biosynthesis protein FlhF [Betaproteobacteria bacterium]NBP38988.1 flagellar biosynthesis protein FlhF [Betaproteobacteria bacterium]NBQ79398.1 flagellar biosynthesis protein FlhF [Betaproteobacteria bacterium]NBS39973.1 flagellar biosynthesis protein FlhF [Betaproteobacteria bacterium]NCV14421.1 flagellar biosynthesis protein FlhF [Betaproteobacteria bacterium]
MSAPGPRRFVAANATEALAMVKQAIGSDAILLSNREVEGGIEVIAMAQEQFKEIAPRATARSKVQAPAASLPDPPSERFSASDAADRAPRPEGLRMRSDSAIRTANHKLVIADVAQRPMRNPNGSPVFSPEVAARHFRTDVGSSVARNDQGAESAQSTGHESAPAQTVQTPAELNMLAERLMGQVSEVKNLLQSHIAGNTWNQLKGVSPGRAEMLKRLLAAGFSPGLSTSLLEEVGEVEESASMIETLKQPLAARMRSIDPVAMFDDGGVFAFIGPTGVGKTTTVAKIAARCVMRFGRKAVSLLSTDTYRIGALEQLRVFGKILGLPVTALRDAEDLGNRLQELERYHVVLIDTAGMGQRDVKMVEQLRVLSDGYKQAKRILVMSATTSLQTMQDVIQAHSHGEGNGIMGVVVTKIDEAMGLAPSVDCLIRHDLPLLFIGNGQQVPEDLHVADPLYLAHRALQPRVFSREFEPDDDMVPVMIADNIAAWMKTRR